MQRCTNEWLPYTRTARRIRGGTSATEEVAHSAYGNEQLEGSRRLDHLVLVTNRFELVPGDAKLLLELNDLVRGFEQSLRQIDDTGIGALEIDERLLQREAVELALETRIARGNSPSGGLHFRCSVLRAFLPGWHGQDRAVHHDELLGRARPSVVSGARQRRLHLRLRDIRVVGQGLDGVGECGRVPAIRHHGRLP